jgi:6-phosphofructokinase 1
MAHLFSNTFNTHRRKIEMGKNSKSIKNIAILCSGGDAPGMNCAIRAAVRSAIFKGIKVWGIKKGYQGLINGDFHPLNRQSVGNILHRGGTILLSSRCPEFTQKKYRQKAYDNLIKNDIQGLVIIGGNGSLTGAYTFFKEFNFPVVGIPGSIDNDIYGTDYSIGFNTAVETAVEAIDRIRDTAFSHERNFLVEVMGRKSPAIALEVGVCTGAENIILPQEKIDYEKIVRDIERGTKRGKKSSIIIVAEGNQTGISYEIQNKLLKNYNLHSHVCILGHILRGGSPSAQDRFIASQMGSLSINQILTSKTPSYIVYAKNEFSSKHIRYAKKDHNKTDKKILDLIAKLSI